jgi:anti-anti-sigma factor
LVSLPAIRMPAWLEDAPPAPSDDPAANGAGACTLSVSRRACEAVVVVRVHGAMDIDGSAAVDHRLQRILAAGNLSRLVIDLSQVSHLDDYGVRALLRAGDAARTTGTQLRVVTGGGAVLEGLDERGMRPLLPTAPDVDSACSEVFATASAHPRDVA